MHAYDFSRFIFNICDKKGPSQQIFNYKYCKGFGPIKFGKKKSNIKTKYGV